MAIHKRVKIFFLVLVIWTSLYVTHKSSEIHADKNTEDSVKNTSYMRYREPRNPISSHGIDENIMVAQQPLRNTPDFLLVYVCALSKSQPAWRDDRHL